MQVVALSTLAAVLFATATANSNCECSIWTTHGTGPLFPDAGPLYPLDTDVNDVSCNLPVDCDKVCSDRLREWEENEIESTTSLVPEGMIGENEIWGELICTRSIQKFVDNGGSTSRYEGLDGQFVSVFVEMSNCSAPLSSWQYVTDGGLHKFCCDENGMFLPDDPACA